MSDTDSKGPRYIVPIRKNPIPVKTIIPEDSSCATVCMALNDEIDRLAKAVKTVEEHDIYGSKRATKAAAQQMNILEKFRNELKKKDSCRCFE